MSLIDKFHKEVGHLIEGDVWEMKYPEVKISDSQRKSIEECAHRYRGSVRMTKGLYYTSDEYERRKKELLNVRIP